MYAEAYLMNYAGFPKPQPYFVDLLSAFEAKCCVCEMWIDYTDCTR